MSEGDVGGEVGIGTKVNVASDTVRVTGAGVACNDASESDEGAVAAFNDAAEIDDRVQ